MQKNSSTLFALLIFYWWGNSGIVWGQKETFRLINRVAVSTLATDVEVDVESNLYLIASTEHKLYKYYAFKGYDSVQSVGGLGTGEQGFNYPTKVQVVNRQEVWVLDRNNERLVLFNTNLRPIRLLEFRQFEARISERNLQTQLVPASFTVSAAGETFVLNQSDNQIFKFDQVGRFESVFGGPVYEQGSLNNAADICMLSDNRVAVADTVGQQVKCFDNLGVFDFRVGALPGGVRWAGCAPYGEGLVFWNKHSIYFQPQLRKPAYKWAESPVGIRDVVSAPKRLYILAGDQHKTWVYIYSIDNE